MPRLTAETIMQNRCTGCDYYQSSSVWCMRDRCVRPQLEAMRREREAMREGAERRRKEREMLEAMDRRTEFLREKSRRGGLAAHGGEKPAVESEEEKYKKRRWLYDQGLTDEAIAKHCGITATGVKSWRHKFGLPAHHDPNKEDRRRTRFDDLSERRMELYLQGLCDREIAERDGTSIPNIRNWRLKRNLPANRPPHGNRRLDPEKEARRMEVYQNTPNDVAAAKELGITANAFWTWRKSRKLPNKWPNK